MVIPPFDFSSKLITDDMKILRIISNEADRKKKIFPLVKREDLGCSEFQAAIPAQETVRPF